MSPLHRTRFPLRLAAGAAALLIAPAAGAQAQPVGEIESTVEMTDTGAEPKREMRYDFQEGSSDTVVVRMTMEMQTAMGEMQMPAQKFPPFEYDVRVGVEEVADDGSARILAEVVDTRVAEGAEEAQGQMASMLAQEIGALKGVTMTWNASDRGRSSGFEVDIAGATPGAAQLVEGLLRSMRQLIMPLPEEAVGSGATWKIRTDANTNGMEITQTGTATLDKLSSKGFTVTTDLIQSAPEQDVQVQGAGQLRVVSYKGEGEATIEGLFKSPAPRAVENHITINAEFEMTQRGQTQTISQTSKLGMDIKRKS